MSRSHRLLQIGYGLQCCFNHQFAVRGDGLNKALTNTWSAWVFPLTELGGGSRGWSLSGKAGSTSIELVRKSTYEPVQGFFRLMRGRNVHFLLQFLVAEASWGGP